MSGRHRFTLLTVLSVVLISATCGQRFVGDQCIVTASNSQGVCELAQRCPQAFNGRRRPDICSYSAYDAIVCCPSTVSNIPSPSAGQRWGENPVWTQGSSSNTQAPINRQRPTRQDQKRPSELKCEEYSRLTMKKISVTSLSLDPDYDFEFDVPDCEFTTPLIVDGELTKPGEFPHMTALGYWKDGRKEFNCGGVLISDEYVLTAAHCTSPEKPQFVRLGDQNLFKSDDGADPKEYNIREVINHPEYQRRMVYNDIALLRLSEKVQFSKFIRPACLWSQHSLNVTDAVATGWGSTDFHYDKSDELLKVLLNIYSNEECEGYYERSRRHPEGIVKSQLCAGNRGGRRDTCMGDSGGPLVVVPGNVCVFHLIGLTSFGKGCGISDAPGVYTRVSSHLDWIEGIVWK